MVLKIVPKSNNKIPKCPKLSQTVPNNSKDHILFNKKSSSLDFTRRTLYVTASPACSYFPGKKERIERGVFCV